MDKMVENKPRPSGCVEYEKGTSKHMVDKGMSGLKGLTGPGPGNSFTSKPEGYLREAKSKTKAMVS